MVDGGAPRPPHLPQPPSVTPGAAAAITPVHSEDIDVVDEAKTPMGSDQETDRLGDYY